ncbi:hypothetical protein H5410_051893 [Solanum commersonii]|uniref:DUF7745 domain-containing protein n=1 Tax=Solanum commersonii TaxID=4109 RepID=A0A9J5WZT3_SOLCO|nr:hypothetical protein H5410_051893 [Solanum commersonii]
MLFKVNPDKHVIRALIQFWDPDRVVFTLKHFELTPTLEEICYFTSLKYRGRGQIIPHSQSGKKFLRYFGLKIGKKLRCFKHNWAFLDYLYEMSPAICSDARASTVWLSTRNGPEREIPEYQVWLRKDRNNISLEGKQGCEDIGTMIWIRYSHLGTKVVTSAMWAQMETILQYLDDAGVGPSNVGASSSLPPPA